MRETFSLQTTISPDYGIGTNWSGGLVPGPGVLAEIEDATVLVDPETVLRASIVLLGAATLSGNGGGFALGADGAIGVRGEDAVFADGAFVNDGGIALLGCETALTVIVENASGVAQAYGLAVPSFENPGGIIVAGGATLAVAGTELSNTGGILLAGGTLAVTGGAVDGGQGCAPPGGVIALTDGAVASFTDGVADQVFSLAGAGTISFADAQDLDGVTIAGFDDASRILLPSVTAGEDALAKLAFTDLPAGMAPGLVPTSSGAELLLEPVAPCFARGTCLLTQAGYVPVEAIVPGDMLVTIAGDVKPVRWVGMRAIDIAAHRRPDAVRPVRILPGAFGPGQPSRQLRLSPDHALLLAGRLVPVKLLVNGATILRERNCQAVTYYHVELARHDILLAENLAVESYLDTGNRGMFSGAAGAPPHSPVFGRGRQWDSRAYADLCLSGPVLRGIRQSLRSRAVALGYRPLVLTEVSLWCGSTKYGRSGGTPAHPSFRLAAMHPGLVFIRSGTFVPAEMGDGEGEDDNRVLGVAIEKLRLGMKTVPLGKVAVSGFHPRAAGDVADWTDGNAAIEIPRHVSAVSLKLAALPQGWATPPGAVALDI